MLIRRAAVPLLLVAALRRRSRPPPSAAPAATGTPGDRRPSRSRRYGNGPRPGPVAVRRPQPRQRRAELADDRAALLPGHLAGAGSTATSGSRSPPTPPATSSCTPRSGLKVASLGAHRTWRLPAKVKGKQVRRWRILPDRSRSKLLYKTRSLARSGARRRATPSSPPAAHRSTLVTPAGRVGLPRRAAVRVGQRLRQQPRHGQRAAARVLPARRRAQGGAGVVAAARACAPRPSPPAPTPRTSGAPTASPPTTSATPRTARSTAVSTTSTGCSDAAVRATARTVADVRRQARVRPVLRQQRRLERRRRRSPTCGPSRTPSTRASRRPDREEGQRRRDHPQLGRHR